MKNIFFLFHFYFFLNFCFAQDYFVTAENGLLVRKHPNDSAKIIGKFDFGTRITTSRKTNYSYSVNENGEKIDGFWTWVEVSLYSSFASEESKGYVFNGFLKKENDFIDEIKEKMSRLPILDNYKIDVKNDIFCLKGDFFGDNIADLVVLIKDNKEDKRIVFINYQKNNIPKTLFLGGKNDPFKMEYYNWVGYFRKINEGEILYSNYDDDFRGLEDVPKNERVVLSYDAIYIHQEESCGGGFIFWKDEKFNWLQQE